MLHHEWSITIIHQFKYQEYNNDPRYRCCWNRFNETNLALATNIYGVNFPFMITYMLQVAYLQTSEEDITTLVANRYPIRSSWMALLPGVRLFSVAKSLALFFGEASAATDGELFLAGGIRCQRWGIAPLIAVLLSNFFYWVCK